MYIEIIDNQIVKTHNKLPDTYKNISNFSALVNIDPFIIIANLDDQENFVIPDGLTKVGVSEDLSKICCPNGWIYYDNKCCPLYDLSWSGNEGVKFYEYMEQRPELPPNSKLVGPNYSIDHDSHTVTGTFEIAPVEPTPPVVPDTISARQIRLWLLQNGVSLQMVADAIATIEDSVLRDSVAIEWEYAPYIERDHPMLVPLAQALGLTESDIDRGFVEAINI